jgi:hypothetical protein
MRPLAFAVVRCTLERRELMDIWEAARDAVEPVVIDGPVPGDPRTAE